MPSIDPTPARFKGLLDAVPEGVPVVMLNMLRFRDQAVYPPGRNEPPRTGREAYEEYERRALERVKAVGGRKLWGGTALHAVIAPDGESWDEIFLVEYPSREVFMNMVRAPEYQAFAIHRTAALFDSRLIALRADGG